MDGIIFLGMFTVIFGIIFAIMLSPWGQKYMN